MRTDFLLRVVVYCIDSNVELPNSCFDFFKTKNKGTTMVLNVYFGAKTKMTCHQIYQTALKTKISQKVLA
jgi:hypothetical protein